MNETELGAFTSETHDAIKLEMSRKVSALLQNNNNKSPYAKTSFGNNSYNKTNNTIIKTHLQQNQVFKNNHNTHKQ